MKGLNRNFSALNLRFALVLLFSAFFVDAGHAFSGSPAHSPINPEFLESIEFSETVSRHRAGYSRSMEKPYRKLGLRHSPLNLSHLKYTETRLRRTAEYFPVSFDLREDHVTPVRDQLAYGTCWAFSSLGSIESVLMPDQNIDLSEKHLAYMAYIGDDGFYMDPGYSVLDQGGDLWMSTAVLARGSAPVLEETVPYGNGDPVTGNYSPVKHLSHVLYLPSQSGDNAINTRNVKHALMNYGAVVISIRWPDYDQEHLFYDESTASFNNPYQGTSNHEVNIVGWDDSYPASNFKNKPSVDGAWIVKNSWGNNFGENGYFYLSYKNAVTCDGAVFVVRDQGPYGSIYQYDPMGWNSSMGYDSETGWFANRFRAKGNEKLKAVSFYSAGLTSDYDIYVYRDCGSAPDSGTLVVNGQSGTLAMPGYHTIELDQEVELEENQNFSVVVRLTARGAKYPIPLEERFEGWSDNARASSGQSFVGWDGEQWSDLTTLDSSYQNSNVCLKAFTDNTSGGQVTCNFFQYSDLPVSGALVSLQGTDIKTITDEEGKFSFPVGINGWYDMDITAHGVMPETRWVFLDDGELSSMKILMSDCRSSGYTAQDNLSYSLNSVAQGNLYFDMGPDERMGMEEAIRTAQELSGKGISVTGKVTASPAKMDQLAISGVRVGLSRGRSVNTGAGGEFAIEGVLPGRYLISYTAPGLMPVFREIEVGASDLSLPLVVMEPAVFEPGGLSWSFMDSDAEIQVKESLSGLDMGDDGKRGMDDLVNTLKVMVK